MTDVGSSKPNTPKPAQSLKKGTSKSGVPVGGKKTPIGSAKKPQVQSKPEMAPSAISEDEGQLTNGAPEDEHEDEDENESHDQEEEEQQEDPFVEDEEKTERDPAEAEAAGDLPSQAGEAKDTATEAAGDAEEQAEQAADSGEEIVPAGKVNEKGEVVDDEGRVIGKVAEGAQDKLDGSIVSQEGEIVDSDGNVLGQAEPVEGVEGAEEAAGEAKEGAEALAGEAKGGIEDQAGEAKEGAEDQAGDAKEGVEGEAEGQSELKGAAANAMEGASQADKPEMPEIPKPELKGPFKIGDNGEVLDAEGQKIGNINVEGSQAKSLFGKDFDNIDSEGNILAEDGNILGKVNLLPNEELPGAETAKDAEGAAEGAADDAAEEAPELPDISILEGLKVNKAGNIVDSDGNVMGKLSEGDPNKLAGKTVSKEGKIWDDQGRVIGQAEVVPEALENLSAPFEDFPDATVDKDGNVIFEGQAIGKVVEGDIEKLVGKKIDADGDICDKNGNVIGKAERLRPEVEPEPEPEEPVDYSMLADKKVNKAGNVVDDKGVVIGRVVEGILKYLIGKKVDKDGLIWNDQGKVIGKCEPIPENEKEDFKEPAPFEDFPDATVQSNGDVLSGGEKIGVLIEGDAKKLKGKSVDQDGDVCDKNGNVLGKAERWEAPEEEPEPEVDMSILAGKRVNKAGNVVDKGGDIYGRLVEGDVKALAGKMCDKEGFIRNEGGDVVGKAELVPQSEREGMKEGPFTDFEGCTVDKEGKVVTSNGEAVGRLIEGDAKKLFGRAVDDDGDILDKNGNVLGKAERWEEPEAEKDVNPMSGRKVNKQGEVVNEDGDVIGRLTDGEIGLCAGKKIDDDGDVVDAKGTRLGHVTLLEDIQEPEPEPEPEGETEEERQEREQREQDRKLASQMGTVVEQSLEKIKPVLRMITQTIDKEERKAEEERDEEALVKEVKPMIEEGGRILTEANGAIRGMDPDGRIQANAKHKTAAREASPEEYHLADLLKELTGWVTETIENAKRKIQDMPHAKKQLNPLWALLAEPLGQILAAVGLLLAGVLGLVGKLLSGLGLGGILDNLLGGLGLKNILGGLGLGGVVGTITGKKK